MQQRSAMEDTDWHELEKERFADDLAELLYKRGHNGGFDKIVLVAAPEGIRRVQEAYPDIEIYTASVDERLDENGYIVPGLGDAGDKIFGTR